MPNFSDMTDVELTDWMTNFIEVAGGIPATFGLTAQQITDLTSLNTDLKARINARMLAEEAAKTATASQQTSRKNAQPFCAFLSATIRANPAVSDADKISVDIEPRKPATRTAPNTPTDLIANGFEDGTNLLKWSRAGNRQGTQYLIEYRPGTEADFQFLATTTETTYTHSGATPGQQCAYRVKAQRAGEQSMYSNVAVVYMV